MSNEEILELLSLDTSPETLAVLEFMKLHLSEETLQRIVKQWSIMQMEKMYDVSELTTKEV